MQIAAKYWRINDWTRASEWLYYSMKEKHDLVAETTASIALNILCQKGHKEIDYYVGNLPNGALNRHVEVELLVNGKSVSWEKAMADMMKIRKEEVDRLVGNRLANILSGEGIKQVVDVLDSMKWTLRQKVEEIIGENIEWPEDY